MHTRRTLAMLTALTLLVTLLTIGPATAAGPQVQPISDSQLIAVSTTIGGASPLATTRTVPHWYGETLDPSNGVTYGYNMVGANPNNCSGSACDVTVETDITPIIVNVAGRTFDGTNRVAATLASPQFALNDYRRTPAATDANFARGSGGELSSGSGGLNLQLQDATQRIQFNKTGSDPYHLRLHANVLPAVTINVPSNHGTLLQSGRGVVLAAVDYGWWVSQIKNLTTKADATHLPLYLTNDVLLYQGAICCTIGFHGAATQSTNGNGNAKVITFAWASYISSGIYARPNGGLNWALQDIHAISHEIAEWADDPFVNNWVEPWLTPTAPQYGCTNILETGDPVVAIGFAKGTNTYFQDPNPWTSPTDHNPSIGYDGYWHPEDEVFLPWFMRTAPNYVSEATQSNSTNVGRYTLMGDLNPFPGFRGPATGC